MTKKYMAMSAVILWKIIKTKVNDNMKMKQKERKNTGIYSEWQKKNSQRVKTRGSASQLTVSEWREWPTKEMVVT